MAIDIFNTRTMLAALEQMKRPKKFLLDTFFRETVTSDTKSVDIDIVKGKRRLAAFVNPVIAGKPVEKRGYSTNTYAPPYIKPKMITTAAELLDRLPGEILYAGAMSPQDRAMIQLGKNLAELDEMITRREEWMAAQVLQTGSVSVVGEGVNDVVSFGMSGTHIITLTGDDLWSASTGTPMDDLRTWKRLVTKDSGLSPDTIVMGTAAVDAFLKHADVRNALDNRRIQLGQIDPTVFSALGVTYYGRLNEIGADLYSYEEYYYDEDTSADVAMVDTKKVIMGSTQAYTRRQYGAIRDLEATASVPRFPKSWISKDPSGRIVQVQSAPLPSLHQSDAFLCAKVLS